MARTTTRISSKLQDLLARPQGQHPMVSTEENWHDPAIASDGPRPVRPSRSTRTLRFVLASALGTVLIAGALIGNASVNKLDELYRDGRTAQGQIVGDIPNFFGGYRITYHYLVGDTYYRSSRDYRTVAYENTELGFPLTITYLPRDPAFHCMGQVNEAEVSALRIAWLLGTLAAGFFIEFLRLKLRRRLRAETDILRDYAAVPAKVVDVGLPVGRRFPQREVTFAARLPNREVQRTSIKMPAFEAERFRMNPETTLLTNLKGDFHILDQIAMAEVDEPRGYPR